MAKTQMTELDKAINKARDGWSEERKELERKREALSAARGETVSAWGATNPRSIGGECIQLTLSKQDGDAAWATTLPTDEDGEYVPVAHYPSAIVTDLVTGKVYRVQREHCGGGCMCGVSAVELDIKSTALFHKQQAQAAKDAVAVGLPADSFGKLIREKDHMTAYVITGFEPSETNSVIVRRGDGGEYALTPALVLELWADEKAFERGIAEKVAAEMAAKAAK